MVDNYAAHKHAAMRAWRVKHPQFSSRFTPTSARGPPGEDLIGPALDSVLAHCR